jgi:hypothetical protein
VNLLWASDQAAVGAQAQAGDTGRAVELATRSIVLLLVIASVALFAIAQEWPW